MSKTFYLTAIKLLKRAYAGECKSDKSTQWSSFLTIINNERWQVLAIPGTNGVVDWFWNLLLLQKDGVKYGAYVSANRIHKKFIQKPETKLMISCHSKSGPTGIYLQELLNADLCVAFCPARGFIEEKENKKVVQFIDGDDIVPKVGWSRFRHRKSKTVELPKDKKWWDITGRIKDHLLDHIEKFIKEEL